MADLVEGPPNKRPKLSENAISDNADYVSFGKSLVWDLENELPDELIDTLHPDLPQNQQSSQSTHLLNGSTESVANETNVVGSITTQRHQQLSQLLQSKPNVSPNSAPTTQGHTGLPSSQRLPSPSGKSPQGNNLSSPNATVNKTKTPVSSSAHITVSDSSMTITNISNSLVNSLSNTTGTMGINSNMLLMQNKSGTLGSQGNLGPLSTSVTVNNIHHTTVLSSQNTNSLINGGHITTSGNVTRGVNPNVSSAVTHSTVLGSPLHQNILGHPSLSNQGANLKNPGVAQLGQANSPFVYSAVSASQIGLPTSISSISVSGQRQAITSIAMSLPPRYSAPIDSNLNNVS